MFLLQPPEPPKPPKISATDTGGDGVGFDHADRANAGFTSKE